MTQYFEPKLWPKRRYTVWAEFKKTVTQHEAFLNRIATHEKLAHDHDLRIFLTFNEDLAVRGQNAQEKVKGFFKSISKTADEVSLLSLKDYDDFFEQNKKFILEYLGRIKVSADQAELFSRNYHEVATDLITICYTFNTLMKNEKNNPIARAEKFAEFLELFETSLEALKVFDNISLCILGHDFLDDF